MKNHIFWKRLTINFLLVFIGIILLLFDTIPCSAQSKKPSEIYKAYIKIADQAFAAQDYEGALPLYKKANEAKPEYNYATDKIDEIEKILAADPDTRAMLAAQSKNSTTIYKTLVAQADYALTAKDYAGALLLYEKAYQTKPDYYYALDKIDEINLILNATPDSKTQLYENTILKAESLYSQNNYQQAKSEYQKAFLIDSSAQLPKDRLKQINSIYTDSDDLGNFNIAVANGDKELADSDFDKAILYYEAALRVHPNAKFVTKKLADTKKQQAEYMAKIDQQAIPVVAADKVLQPEKPTHSATTEESLEPSKTGESQAQPVQPNYASGIAVAKNTSTKEAYDIAIKNGDQSLGEKKYDVALTYYRNALTLIPGEKYPSQKTAEITAILAKQKSDSENYAQAIRTGEKAFAAGNYSLALASFQDAQKIKPSEKYPIEKIDEIKAITAGQLKIEEKYANALKTGDQLLAGKEYKSALTAYTEAAELKKNEKYPQDQLAKINKIIADSRSVEDNYTLAITEGDKLFSMKDYSGAKSSFAKAAQQKPAETYPRQRINEIDKLIEATSRAYSAEYTKALEVADNLYNTKVFDQAIDAYESAAKINPGDAYPEEQIGKIRKYISDHVMLDLYSQTLIISSGNEKKFTFSAIDPGLRKNNYILLKVRSTGKTAPKVYLNYGKDSQKNGGIVLRNLDKSTISDYLISISIQDKWFREENNWISISVETGDIEITKVQISSGE